MPEWLNPRHPKGMCLWGTAAMCLIVAALSSVHGRHDEVWPNRCVLLRTQLADRAEYELTATLSPESLGPLLPSSLTELKLQLSALPAEPKRPALALTMSASSARAELTGELYMLPKATLETLDQALGGAFSSELLEPSLGIAELSRRGLRLSPHALTCSPSLFKTEREIALSLLLKGGLQAQVPSGLQGFGLRGAQGWFARWGEGSETTWRLWSPIPSGDRRPAGWMMVWTAKLHAQAPAPLGDPSPSALGAQAPLTQVIEPSSLSRLEEGLRSLSAHAALSDPDGYGEALTWLQRAARDPSEP